MDSSTQFTFHVATNVRFGRGCAGTLPDLPEVRGKRCMLLCYPGFHRPDLFSALQASCAGLSHPDEFEENPSHGFVRTLGECVAEQAIDTIIAIGGGSSIDSAKAAAWFAANPDWNLTETNRQVRIPNVSIIAVPTTAGTGSEVTPYAILTDSSSGKKHILNHAAPVPRVALCDPDLTVTLPPKVTADTGIDALSHAVEAYLSKKCQGVLDDLALAASRKIVAGLPRVMDRPEDLCGREQVMLAALEGGIVLAHCGTVIVHALGYGLTAAFGYSHGLSNAILLAGFVDRLAKRGSDRARRILAFFADGLDGFIRRSGIETKLPADDIDDGRLDAWVETAYNSYGRPNCVVPLEREDIRHILLSAMP